MSSITKRSNLPLSFGSVLSAVYFVALSSDFDFWRSARTFLVRSESEYDFFDLHPVKEVPKPKSSKSRNFFFICLVKVIFSFPARYSFQQYLEFHLYERLESCNHWQNYHS